MKTSQYRLLRPAILVLAGVYTLIFSIRSFSWLGGEFAFLDWVFLWRGVILMLIGLVIVIKLSRMNEHIFFALFLVNFAFYSWLLLDTTIWALDTFAWSVTAGSFVYAMIVYPGTSAVSMYSGYFAAKKTSAQYKRIVLYFTGGRHFWFILFPILVCLRLTAYFYSEILAQSLNIFVIICGLIYFRISYSLAGKTDRSRLAWILWGATVSLFLTLIDVLILIFYPEAPVILHQIFIALTAFTVCLSIVMGVFFAGFLDTALVVRGTIVYSAVFLAVIFLFSFIEHYILYGLSVMLHIDGGMTAAFLAGFLSLIVQPIHKILEHKLPKF